MVRAKLRLMFVLVKTLDSIFMIFLKYFKIRNYLIFYTLSRFLFSYKLSASIHSLFHIQLKVLIETDFLSKRDFRGILNYF